MLTAFTPDPRIRDLPGFLALKNIVNVAMFRWRWHQHGGSPHWRARPLMDLRDAKQLARWRRLDFEARRLRIPPIRADLRAVVVDLNHWKELQKRIA